MYVCTFNLTFFNYLVREAIKIMGETLVGEQSVPTKLYNR